VARCYQRVLLVDSGISEDTSAADTSESVVSSPQIDSRLAAEEPEKVHGSTSGGLVAAEGDPKVPEILDVLLSALGKKGIASKCELVHNLSSRPDFKAALSNNRDKKSVDPQVPGHKERPRADGGELVHDEHAKRGRFKGFAHEGCTDEGLSDFFSKMSMESSTSGEAMAVPPGKYLDKCIMTAIQHLSAHLDEDATCKLDAAMNKIQLKKRANPPLPVRNDDHPLVAGGVAVSARKVMELGDALLARSSENQVVAEAFNLIAHETKSLPSLLSRHNNEPIQPFMTKDQEERARMMELFKAVNPAKLAILDELAERRKTSPNGFDQMWLSYEEKWGTEAVERAFSKVREAQSNAFSLMHRNTIRENQGSSCLACLLCLCAH